MSLLWSKQKMYYCTVAQYEAELGCEDWASSVTGAAQLSQRTSRLAQLRARADTHTAALNRLSSCGVPGLEAEVEAVQVGNIQTSIQKLDIWVRRCLFIIGHALHRRRT